MDVASFSNVSLEGSKKRAGQTRKILVVEDDKDVTALLRVVLLDTVGDAQVDWATSFEDSVKHLIENSDIVQSIPYDLIIADIFLEGNGIGLDLFKLINRTYSEVPFLIISSLPYEMVLDSLGQDKKDNFTFLPKPFQLSQCKDKVKNLIARKLN